MERISWREVAVALSAANLMFVREWSMRLNRTNLYYLSIDGLRPYLIALIFNVLLVTVIFLNGLSWVRIIGRPWARRWAGLVFMGVVLIQINSLRTMARINVTELLAGDVRIYLGVGAVGVIVAMAVFFRWQTHIVRGFIMVMLVIFPYVVMTFGQAMWLMIKPDENIDIAKVDAINIGKKPQVRVLWIIFDTMDQRVAFESRPDDVELPEIDRLRGESFYALNAYSPNKVTAKSIPSLFTGRRVIKSEVADENELLITYEDIGEMVEWSKVPNIFSRTRDEGYKTAVAGRAYHPYCKLFNYITSCLEKMGRENDGIDNNRVEEVSNIMIQQIYRLQPWWGLLTGEQRVKIYNQSLQSMEVYQGILKNVKGYSRDPDLDLIFAHFNIPHDPYIYDRYTDKFKIQPEGPEGYFNNLVLVDRTLGEIRMAMEEAGDWKNTAVIVTADHNWQKSYEYDGKVKERGVPFILRLPGQKNGVVYEEEFETIVTGDLILGIMRGEITDYEDVGELIDRGGLK